MTEPKKEKWKCSEGHIWVAEEIVGYFLCPMENCEGMPLLLSAWKRIEKMKRGAL